MRYLLDTNVLSNITKPEPSASLVTWMAEQADSDLFVASVTIAEIHRGILEMPAGKKRVALEAWFAGNEGPHALFTGRILSFDERAALILGELMARGKAAGRTRSAVAKSNSCIR